MCVRVSVRAKIDTMFLGLILGAAVRVHTKNAARDSADMPLQSDCSKLVPYAINTAATSTCPLHNIMHTGKHSAARQEPNEPNPCALRELQWHVPGIDGNAHDTHCGRARVQSTSTSETPSERAREREMLTGVTTIPLLVPTSHMGGRTEENGSHTVEQQRATVTAGFRQYSSPVP